MTNAKIVCRRIFHLKADCGPKFERMGDVKLTGPEVIEAAQDAIYMVALVSAPLMIIGTVVGVVVSLFQALTQLQEMTLIYVPKIIATFIALVLALPFMADALHNYTERTMIQIVRQK